MAEVLVAGTRIDALEARFDPDAVATLLAKERAHGGHALCLCTDPPRKLVIRLRMGKLHLAVWPDDGALHDPACPFYRDARADVGAVPGRVRPAVIETVDGYDVHLGLALDLPAGTPRGSKTSSAHQVAASDAAPARAALGVEGLLRHLWDAGDLNRWRSGWTRDWGRVHYELRRAAAECVVNGQPLIDRLYVVPPWRRDRVDELQDHWAKFAARLTTDVTASRRPTGLLLGEVRELRRSQHGWRLQLRHLRPPVFLAEELHRGFQRQHLRAVAAIGTQDAVAASKERVIALMQVEMTRAGNLRAIAGSLLLVDPHYIPVQSAAETRLVRHLVAQRRSFVRPLRGHGDQVLPDLALVDTRPRTAMLVHTSTTVATLKHADRLRAQLAATGQAVWEWFAEESTQWPDLPPPSPLRR